LVPVTQLFRPEIKEQSLSIAHGLHVFVAVSQTGAPAVLQSAFVRHATQLLLVVLHCGFAASLHVSLFTHSTHAFAETSQVDFPILAAQSALAVHSTQVFTSVLQTGFKPEQFVFPKHSTHLSAILSQTGVVSLQLPSQGNVICVLPTPPPPFESPPVFAIPALPPLDDPLEPPFPPFPESHIPRTSEQSVFVLKQPTPNGAALTATNEIIAKFVIFICIALSSKMTIDYEPVNVLANNW
jgi:hypothetical protein